MDVLGGLPRIDADVSGRIRSWVLGSWPPPRPGLITVSQLRCKKPDCPTLETVVIVAPQPGTTHRIRFHLPAADITERQVACAIRALQEDQP